MVSATEQSAIGVPNHKKTRRSGSRSIITPIILFALFGRPIIRLATTIIRSLAHGLTSGLSAILSVFGSAFRATSGTAILGGLAVGVILGLWATGTALSVMGMVGILILVGIVVKNGIVLIDYTILCRERGMSVLDASVTAARSRLRPILMTTLTTVLGMLPMALGRGDGAELWNGLGMVVCWGLTISTLVTLVLIPAVYCVFATRQEKRASKKYEII